METKQIISFLNFNNNCYLNVILQILLCIPKAKDIIMNDLIELRRKEEKIKDTPYLNITYSPKEIITKLNTKLKANNQNDCLEALEIICDQNKQIEKLLYGELKTSLKCSICNKERSKTEPFLTIGIYDNNIEQSFINLLSSSEDDLDCDHCKARTKTNKSTVFKTIGDILILQNVLKIDITLNKSIKFNGNIYKLKGIVKHYGVTQGGHYFYIDYENEILISDADIHKIEKNKIDTKNIYLFFYKKEI